MAPPNAVRAQVLKDLRHRVTNYGCLHLLMHKSSKAETFWLVGGVLLCGPMGP